ncbi:MAG TPA: hypothetical protein VIG55_09945 [Methylosinus sp.]|jgi:hypothetical protein
MSKMFPAIEASHRDFILEQKLFFVASAACGARVDLSPESPGPLRPRDEGSAVLTRSTRDEGGIA